MQHVKSKDLKPAVHQRSPFDLSCSMSLQIFEASNIFDVKNRVLQSVYTSASIGANQKKETSPRSLSGLVYRVPAVLEPLTKIGDWYWTEESASNK